MRFRVRIVCFSAEYCRAAMRLRRMPARLPVGSAPRAMCASEDSGGVRAQTLGTPASKPSVGKLLSLFSRGNDPLCGCGRTAGPKKARRHKTRAAETTPALRRRGSHACPKDRRDSPPLPPARAWWSAANLRTRVSRVPPPPPGLPRHSPAPKLVCPYGRSGGRPPTARP